MRYEVTAKELAAEIGKILIEQKKALAHGEFIPWIEKHCSFTREHASRYMKIARTKCPDLVTLDRCSSIREVLDLKKTSKAPKQETRAATLNQL